MYRVRTSNIGIIAFIYVHSSSLTRKHKDWLCDRTVALHLTMLGLLDQSIQVTLQDRI